MLFLLILTLLLICILAYYTLQKDICSPFFLFAAGFVICSLVALWFGDEWRLNGTNGLKFQTYLVISLGVLSFYIGCVLSKMRFKSSPRKNQINNFRFKPIPKKYLIVIFFLYAVSCLLYAKAKLEVTGSLNLQDALGEYNENSKFGDQDMLMNSVLCKPYVYISLLNPFWSILLPIYYYKRKKFKIHFLLILSLFLIASAGTLLSGGRSGMMVQVGAILVFFYIVRQNNYDRCKISTSVNRKFVFVGLSVLLLFVLLFNLMGILVGREGLESNVGYSFAIYCGAQIKNLDLFFSNPWHISQHLFCEQTFNSLYTLLAEKTGDFYFKPNVSYEFFSVGNFDLGNVYSCFFNYYYDLKMVGVVVFPLVAGFFFQFLNIKTRMSAVFYTGRPDMYCLFYASFIVSVFMSFFSEQMYYNLNFYMIFRNYIGWSILIYLLYGKKRKYAGVGNCRHI